MRRSTKNTAECGGNFETRSSISSNFRSLKYSNDILSIKGSETAWNSFVQNRSKGEAPTAHAIWFVSGRTCKIPSIHFLKSNMTATGASFEVSRLLLIARCSGPPMTIGVDEKNWLRYF